MPQLATFVELFQSTAWKRLIAELEQEQWTFPHPFEDWVRRITTNTQETDQPPVQKGLAGRLLAYAIVCRSILLACSGRTNVAELTWDHPQGSLALAWLDAIAERSSVSRLDGMVKQMLEEQQFQLDGDPLRLAYEKVISTKVRRSQGEHYTPDWLADHVVEQLWEPELAWVDPSVGAGAFLLALERKSRLSGQPFCFTGIDSNPWAVLAASANAGWMQASRAGKPVTDFTIPIVHGDVVADADFDRWAQPTYDRVVGNPPWIVWDRLGPEYRLASVDACKHYGLFSETGMASILGGGKKDLAMLVTYAALDKLLHPNGRLGFVITQSVFTAAGSARGFRRWTLPDNTPVHVDAVEDLSAVQPFPGINPRVALLYLTKGVPTSYPVPYHVWKSRSDSDRSTEKASPSEPADDFSSWVHASDLRGEILERVMGPCAYHAHLGVNTGGANGIYWFKRISHSGNGLWLMENLAHRGRQALPVLQVELEESLLYPVLLGNDVTMWNAVPSAWILLAQDPRVRRGIDRATMEQSAPKSLEYLRGFESQLRQRAAFRRYFTRPNADDVIETGPFYSMFDVGSYTLSSHKVVWNRMGSRLAAAVVGGLEGRPILPQETHCLFEVSSETEGHYLTALLNSPWARMALEAMGQVGGKSFATPRSIQRLRIDRYNSDCAIHQTLSECARRASEQHRLAGAMEPSTLNQLETLTAEYWSLPRSSAVDV